MYVEDKGAYWLVGMTSSNRRLLSATQGGPATTLYSRSSLCQDALVMHMPNTMRDCRQACQRSLLTVQQLNLAGTVPDCAFGSSEDFVHAVESQPMLLGNVLFSIPMWPQIILRHSPLHVASGLFNASSRAAGLLLRMAATDNITHTLTFDRTDTGAIRIASTNPRLIPDSIAQSIQTTLNVVEAWVGTFVFDDTKGTHNASARRRASPSRRLLFAEVVASVEKSLAEFDSLRDSYASQITSVFNYRYADVDTEATRAAWLYDMGPDLPSGQERRPPCQLFSDILGVFSTSIGGLQVALRDNSVKATPAPSLREAWKVVTPVANGSAPVTERKAGTFLKTVLDELGLPSLFFYTAFEAIVHSVKRSASCDYMAVQTCSKWRIHLFHGIIIVGVWFAGWFVLCSLLNLGFVAVMTLPAFTVVIMSVCYDYSFTCAPMVPVCLYEDIVAAWRMVLPHQMAVPGALLLDSDTCQHSAQNPTPACIRACSDPPLAFTSWYSPAAWIAVELGAQELPWLTWIPMLDRDAFDIELRLRLSIALDADDDFVTAHRICTVSTLHLLVPFLFAAFMAVVLVRSVLQSLVAIVSSGILTIGMLFASASTDDDPANDD